MTYLLRSHGVLHEVYFFKHHMEFFETKSSSKDSTAFEEIYLMEYSMAMQKKYYDRVLHEAIKEFRNSI